MTSLRNVLTISKNGNDRKYGDSDSVSIDVFILTTMAPRPTHKGVKRFAPAAAPAFFVTCTHGVCTNESATVKKPSEVKIIGTNPMRRVSTRSMKPIFSTRSFEIPENLE